MSGPIIWCAGVGWDDVPGTDKRLAKMLAQRRPVAWIDSPHRGVWRGWWRRQPPAVTHPVDGLTRFRAPAPPGFSRPGLRVLTRSLHARTARHGRGGRDAEVVIVAGPVIRFPRMRGLRMLYVTDDWLSGADLMGFSYRHVRRTLASNLREADIVAAVSPALLEAVLALAPSQHVSRVVSLVLPNGAPEVPRMGGIARERVAGVVGQLNERLDLELISELADSGIRIRLIGPRAAANAGFVARLDALIAHRNVEWVGPVEPAELPAHLARLGVGLTPYADSAFNRASFPLKTLEYLAAGLSVVSTELPASRWLDSAHVAVAADAAAFIAAVRARLEALSSVTASRDEQACVAVAAAHGWDRRASDLLAAVTAAGSAQRNPIDVESELVREVV